MNKYTHNCENNIESNMTPAHCRVCGKELKTDTQNWKEGCDILLINHSYRYSLEHKCPIVYKIEHCSEPDCPSCNKVAYEKGRRDEREEMIGVMGEKIDTTGIEYAEEPMDDESRAKKITAIVKNAIISDFVTKLKERQ